MAENKPFGEASDVLTPVTNDGLALAAMIEASRAQTQVLMRVLDKVDGLGSAVAKVREDIAVMQVRNEDINVLKNEVDDLKETIQKLELRNAEQNGAAKFLTFVKDFGPWLLAIVAATWASIRG